MNVFPATRIASKVRLHHRRTGALCVRYAAYLDIGSMADYTRWKPRQVFCTEQPDHQDTPGELHVVKYRQGKAGACALISEVVCGQLLRLADIPAVEGRLVFASDDFAARYQSIPDVPYRVEPGWAFWQSIAVKGHPGAGEKAGRPGGSTGGCRSLGFRHLGKHNRPEEPREHPACAERGPIPTDCRRSVGLSGWTRRVGRWRLGT